MTARAETARTSDAYTPCVVVHPDGRTVRGNVMRGRLMDAATAHAEHRAGRVVWVAGEQEAEAVKGGE
jgi:hypothetical protein